MLLKIRLAIRKKVLGPENLDTLASKGALAEIKKLEAKIIEIGKLVSEAILSGFESQFLSIESSEPAALGALVTQCHNELCEAYGLRENITPLPIWQKILKNYFDFDQTMCHSSR